MHLNPNVREPVNRLLANNSRIALIEPAGYEDFIWLMNRCTFMLSDSGGVQEEAPYRFLYVSIVNFYKHQWNVVEAVAALRKQGVPVQLDLVGPAYEPALVRLLESLDKHDPEREFITYHGKIPYDELAEVYERADAFIWASSCEAFGMILIEAMSAGLPTACSSMSCMPELFEDCGWYFSPENVESLAVALEEMISNPRTREHKAQSGVKRANCSSWQKCADQTFQHLVEVANS